MHIDTVTEVELNEKHMTIPMKKKEYPNTILEQVTTIQNCYNSVPKKEENRQFIAAILKASLGFATVIGTTEHGPSLELLHMRVVMSWYYHLVYNILGGKNDNNENGVLLLS